MSINPSQSSELVELHVYYVPKGSWNYKLNTISIEVIHEFISAGFIRVSPDLTLQALRERLVDFLGEDAIAEKFLFLKCIGNNLAVCLLWGEDILNNSQRLLLAPYSGIIPGDALGDYMGCLELIQVDQVKTNQESELKLKSFAPPYICNALQPELYLLPIVDHLGNVFSASTETSLDDQLINNNVAEDDGIIYKPMNISLSNEEPGTDSSLFESTVKDLDWNQEEVSAEGEDNSEENKTEKYQSENSDLPRSLEDSKNKYIRNEKSPFIWKNEDDRVCIIRKEDNQISKHEYIILPNLSDFPSLPPQPICIPGVESFLEIERENVIEQINQVKEERLHLESIKEELTKKVEQLFEQKKWTQHDDSDVWKKKYFETKKVTASLEDILTKLREDLELFYKKLLMQLEAREIKMRPKNMANITESKNYFIIQITEVQHAIDQLKRKLDTDQIKLIIEIKMRKQAISDLRELKAELAQKTIDISLQPELGVLGYKEWTT